MKTVKTINTFEHWVIEDGKVYPFSILSNALRVAKDCETLKETFFSLSKGEVAYLLERYPTTDPELLALVEKKKDSEENGHDQNPTS